MSNPKESNKASTSLEIDACDLLVAILVEVCSKCL